MIALDTNVIVRLLVADDRRQERRARTLVESAAERGEACFVSDVVLCEVEWVLEAAYGASRADLLLAVRALLGQPGLTFEDRPRVAAALARFERGRGDLSDYLLGLRGEAEGATTTYTFDRALRGQAGFTMVA